MSTQQTEVLESDCLSLNDWEAINLNLCFKTCSKYILSNFLKISSFFLFFFNLEITIANRKFEISNNLQYPRFLYSELKLFPWHLTGPKLKINKREQWGQSVGHSFNPCVRYLKDAASLAPPSSIMVPFPWRTGESKLADPLLTWSLLSYPDSVLCICQLSPWTLVSLTPLLFSAPFPSHSRELLLPSSCFISSSYMVIKHFCFGFSFGQLLKPWSLLHLALLLICGLCLGLCCPLSLSLKILSTFSVSLLGFQPRLRLLLLPL